MVIKMKGYTRNPEVYNHMSSEEKRQYEQLLQGYNHGRGIVKGLAIFCLIVGIFSLLAGISATKDSFASEGDIGAGIGGGIIAILISLFLFSKSGSKAKATVYEQIKELENIVKYRVKKRTPQTKVEDWRERKEPDYKKEVSIKKEININKKISQSAYFCSECGLKLKKIVRFCPKCGKKQ